MIGEPDDKYEKEADRIADEVMRMPDPRVQRACPTCEEEDEPVQMKPLADRITPLVQRQVDPEEEEEEETLQMQPEKALQRQAEQPEEEEEELLQPKRASHKVPRLSTQTKALVRGLQGGGRPLTPEERGFFEPRFGRSFGQVRIHVGGPAMASAREVRARAFTVKHSIVFGGGQYAPQTTFGRRLLAHELTHVVQQCARPGHPGMRTTVGGTEAIRTLPSHIPLESPPTHGSEAIQRQEFRDCTPARAETGGTQEDLDRRLLGIRMLAELMTLFAGVSANHVRDGTAVPAEQTAFNDNFGHLTPDQIDTVCDRLDAIRTRVESNRWFICNSSTSSYCAQGWVSYAWPGTGPYIHLCPLFFTNTSPEPNQESAVIHEAAHIAGAPGETYPGPGYPPANAHDNAPSYAGFARDVPF